MKTKIVQLFAAAVIVLIGATAGYYILDHYSLGASDSGSHHELFLPIINGPPDLTSYVAPNGSDSKGTGTVSDPWATITHAVMQVEDKATIVVRPGVYNGRVELIGTFPEGIVIRSEIPYQAQLRNNDQVLICFKCQGITIEGFDLAHNGPGADRYIIQIQSSSSDGGRRVILRNNIIHDSYNNDLLKINSGARDIVVEGNMFYNQHGQDSHLDITSAQNITIQDNLFFNDFSGANRAVENNTGSFLVIKDVDGDSDGILGTQNITVRRNVFLNWQGAIGNAFINFGDNSSVSYHHAHNILVENNLLIGNSDVVVHTPFKLISSRDIIFRHNTIVGDMPTKAFGFRLADGSQTNDNISFYNNVWSDPTGTMGVDDSGSGAKFAATENVGSFILDNNLYWNGGLGIPFSANQPINFSDDANAITGNPQLESNQATIIPPRWIGGQGLFADGSPSISDAFMRLVEAYGRPGAGSVAIDRANPAYAPATDILGRPRTAPDIGAYELP